MLENTEWQVVGMGKWGVEVTYINKLAASMTNNPEKIKQYMI
jgi:hypothetical protein